MWLWKSKEPDPPENVRIVIDGEVWPVELTYVGKWDGIHHWVAVSTAPFWPLGAGAVLKCDVLPAKTSIEVRGRIPKS